MSDARDDRQGEICHVLGKQQGVESRHVACGTSAADNHNTIVVIYMGVNLVEGRDDTPLYTFALHERFI